MDRTASGQRRVGTGADRLRGHQLADPVVGQVLLVAVERAGGLDRAVGQDGREQVAQGHHPHHPAVVDHRSP
jgi:hypothetical protein